MLYIHIFFLWANTLAYVKLLRDADYYNQICNKLEVQVEAMANTKNIKTILDY